MLLKEIGSNIDVNIDIYDTEEKVNGVSDVLARRKETITNTLFVAMFTSDPGQFDLTEGESADLNYALQHLNEEREDGEKPYSMEITNNPNSNTRESGLGVSIILKKGFLCPLKQTLSSGYYLLFLQEVLQKLYNEGLTSRFILMHYMSLLTQSDNVRTLNLKNFLIGEN